VLSLLASLLLAAPQLPGLVLSWKVPEGCPDADALVAQVHARLADPGHTATVKLAVTGQVEQRAPDAWRLTLETDGLGTHGQRTLEAGSCTEAVEAASIVIALAVEEVARQRSPLPIAGTPLAGEARTWSFLVRPSLRGGLAGLPAPLASYGLALGTSVANWRLELEVSRGLPQVTGNAQMEVEVAGALRTCRTWSLGRWEPAACLGAQVGAESGQGVGIAVPGSGTAAFGGATLGACVGWALNRTFWLHFELEGLLLAVRPEFVIQDGGLAYQPPAFVPSASLGVEARF
jgi:hypothetical protein